MNIVHSNIALQNIDRIRTINDMVENLDTAEYTSAKPIDPKTQTNQTSKT